MEKVFVFYESLYSQVEKDIWATNLDGIGRKEKFHRNMMRPIWDINVSLCTMCIPGHDSKLNDTFGRVLTPKHKSNEDGIHKYPLSRF